MLILQCLLLFLKTMKLYKDICPTLISHSSAKFFSLTDWRHKRLKNKIDLLLFYKEHFYEFSESELVGTNFMLLWLSTFFSWGMHYLQHIFFNVLILFHVPVQTTAMIFLSPAMGSVRIWSFYFARKYKFKDIWPLLDLKFVKCLSEWHTSLLLEERNGAFNKETPSPLQGFEIRQCHLTLKGT